MKGQHKYGYDGAPLSIQESSLTKLLGIDGQGLKRLRQNDGGGDFLNWLQYEKTSGQEIPDHTISWLCKEGITPRDLKFIYGKMSITQIHHYIVRQMKESQMSSHSVITWTDSFPWQKGCIWTRTVNWSIVCGISRGGTMNWSKAARSTGRAWRSVYEYNDEDT